MSALRAAAMITHSKQIVNKRGIIIPFDVFGKIRIMQGNWNDVVIFPQMPIPAF